MPSSDSIDGYYCPDKEIHEIRQTASLTGVYDQKGEGGLVVCSGRENLPSADDTKIYCISKEPEKYQTSNKQLSSLTVFGDH